jgi:hypothetical protein
VSVFSSVPFVIGKVLPFSGMSTPKIFVFPFMPI